MNPRIWPNSKMQGLEQTGPETSEIVQFRVDQWYKVPNIAALRNFRSKKAHERALVILLGEVTPYDGLLQGIYDYVPSGLQNLRDDDGASWVIVNDGASAWRKLT